MAVERARIQLRVGLHIERLVEPIAGLGILLRYRRSHKRRRQWRRNDYQVEGAGAPPPENDLLPNSPRILAT